MAEPATDRDPFELIAAEFTERCRNGQCPSIDEYTRAHPELADEIRELFPTIAAIEQAKSASPGRTGGGPVRGGVGLERLGDYRIIRELGRGGMGIVYEAEQESLGRRVALKVLPQQFLLTPAQLERFQREARTAARLHHTNIVPIFGVGQHEGHHFIVMQYIRGVGLDAIVRQLQRLLLDSSADEQAKSAEASASRTGESTDALNIARSLASQSAVPESANACPDDQAAGNASVERRSQTARTPTTGLGLAYWRRAVRVLLQAADALEYAHRQGTLHRDIKPANLLIDADGTVWVADFGLAKAIDDQGVTQTGDLVGTLRYMAPEQFKGRHNARSDVYSLGLTLYELATLRPAFAETSKTSLIDAIARGQPKSPRQLCPHMPRDLETVILKCTAADPASRYASAGALADDLRRFLEDRPIQARRATVVKRMSHWSRRNPAMAALTGTVAALLIAVAAIASVAYVHTNRANVKVRQALAGEQTQRMKAEATSDLAIEVLDTIFEQFAPTRTRTASKVTVDGIDGAQIEVPMQTALSPETAALLEHMLDFYRRLAAQEGADPGIRLKVAEANRRVGDIHHRLGDLDEAKEAYVRAIKRFDNLQSDSDVAPTARLALARIRNQLGTILIEQEHVADGRSSFQEARMLLEPMQTSLRSSEAIRFELARTCYLLAKAPRPPIPTPPERRPGMMPPPGGPPPRLPGVRGPRGPDRRPPMGPGGPPPLRRARFEEGDDPWSQAVDILTDLRAEHPNVPDYRYLLALCYRDMPPPVPMASDDHPTPFDAMTRAIEILEQLVSDFPESSEYRYDLSETYAMSAVAELCPGPDRKNVEQQRLQAALEISERLVDESPNIPAYATSQVHIRMRFADFLRRTGRSEDAERQLQTARTIQTTLAGRFADMPVHQVFVAVIEGALARLLRDDGRLDDARTHFQQAIAVLSELPDGWQRPPYVRNVQVATYTGLARVCRRLGDRSAAREAMGHAEEYRLER